MHKLVLIRHGESQWNKENRFTGWVDVELSEKGEKEAIAAGKLIQDSGLEFDRAYSSLLKRAINTLNRRRFGRYASYPRMLKKRMKSEKAFFLVSSPKVTSSIYIIVFRLVTVLRFYTRRLKHYIMP